MPSCTVCGENEFEARDGLFFCSMCMTQSQDMRQEEAAEFIMDVSNPGFKHLIKSKEHQKKGDKGTKRDKGRPWSCYEGFQIILKEQVKALIRLGADPKLKDVVFRLWCKYLAKIKVAFTEDLEKVDPLLKKFERHREKYPGTTDDPDIKPVKLHKIWKKKSTVADATTNIENQELQFSLRDEDFYDEDNPFQCVTDNHDLDDEYDTDSDDNIECEQDGQTSSSLTRRSYAQHAGFMNVKKTLVFCYIGLLYTNPVTTAVDIVRWVHQKDLPYEKASKLLPEDMKFGPYDSNTFHAPLPVYEEMLRKDAGQMIKYLDLQDVPTTPIRDLINKYVVALELPGDLHGFVHKIHDLTEYKKRYKNVTLRSYDSVAMAFIIITVETLMGLDGSTERKLSKISKKMEALLPGVRLFVWDDWVCHHDKKQKLTLTRLMTNAFDMRVLDNVDQITTSFRHARRRVGRHTDKQTLKKFQESSQSALLLPLKKLSEVEESALSVRDAANQEKDNTETGGSSSHESTDQTSELRSDDNRNYRTCRLKHITQPEHFLDLLKQELCESRHYTTVNTAREDRFGNNSVEDTSANDTVEGTLGNVTVVHSTNHTKTVGDSSEGIFGDGEEILNVKDQEQYNIMIQKLVMILSERQLDKNFGKKSMLTSNCSYRWLVHKCALLIETSDTELNRHVNQIQNILLKFFVPSQRSQLKYFNERFVGFLYHMVRKSKLCDE
ncbi:TATA box-binding protein-associated factor RNA polymerase I subunit B-like [Ylistrum balloti]|uniref:TATA box-binding protein-associated factor RNA polymerase I subunit B-like n=1 Tax=Ylistrum balloti TaxID=509963 RepID=UPI002905AB32|nr:TATA box-binding protein-associated factor RNA polymerase I subunit B-like [Ylistrum balloti]